MKPSVVHFEARAVMRIHRIAQRAFEKLRLREPGGNLARPVDALERIHAGDDIATREQQTQHLLRCEADIGIDPEEMRVLRMHQKMRDGFIARA
ncbi:MULTISPECIES: hypothetical protein [unclassified Caballeronia]|uniref:hypothetical protein n=1 Tax=unclassified Caballeronia TaxID=2646786 RepID=UPI002027C200|nr:MULTISPECIES: hypothetical protein [unclassified Caballeronia]